MPLDVVLLVAQRVYSRPAGDVRREIGEVAITLDALAENVGMSVSEEADREFARVLSKDKDWWTRKHGEKIAAGIADLTPV